MAAIRSAMPVTWASLFVVASSLVVWGCSTAKAEKKPLAAPAYEAREGDRLDVRADLFSMLSFAKVEPSAQKATLNAFGRVAFAPGGSYALRAPTSAVVERVLVAVGDQVKTGQTLAILHSSEVARLRGDSARLSVLLGADEAALRRVEAVIAQGAAPEREAAELRAKIAGTRAELSSLQSMLSAMQAGGGAGDRIELKAAQDGQVLARNITTGERVQADATEAAFVIGDPNKVVIRGAFPERDSPFLERGAACAFRAPALGAERFDGTVTQVLRAVDPRTQTVDVLCAPTRFDARLSADMAVRVEVAAGATGALWVPRSAVLLRKDDRVVFVKTGEHSLERRKVQVGASLRESVQVSEGVKAGEEVIVKNAILLDGELDEVL